MKGGGDGRLPSDRRRRRRREDVGQNCV